jgi:hypothetical protein
LRTWKPTVAGILTIASGCYGIGIGAAVSTAGSLVGLFTGLEWLAGIGAGLIVMGVIALIGGIFALNRKHWGFALAGAIVSLPLVPAGTVLGILSIIFLKKSNREFILKKD